MGYKVVLQKFDPYLNVDPGTMSPFQHGEVFVTDDGAETDLDLGHYERFVDEALTKYSSNSAGQIYESVIENERKGVYLGKTVQVIPHITNEIKGRIQRLANDYDIVITEIGGTVGDIESLPFLEAVRQLRLDLGYYNTLYILLTYVPYIKSAGELKTKPSQHSAYKLREIGIQPDILLCRSEKPFAEDIYNKIALFTNVPRENVINAIDVDCVYEIPLNFQKAGLPEIICQHFKLEQRPIIMQDWLQFLENTKNAKETVTIAVCGKYIQHQDAYKSIREALLHAGSALLKKVEIIWIDSERNFKEVQTALGIAKIKETNKNIEAIGKQLEALKKDVITRQITAEAAKENAKTLGERLIKEMEVKGQELELQEKRMILDAIQGGVDSMLKFGFLKKKGGK